MPNMRSSLTVALLPFSLCLLVTVSASGQIAIDVSTSVNQGAASTTVSNSNRQRREHLCSGDGHGGQFATAERDWDRRASLRGWLWHG